MGKTIKSLGPVRYIDEVYALQGGSARFIKMKFELKLPNQPIEDQFGVNRDTIRTWARLISQELNLPLEEDQS